MYRVCLLLILYLIYNIYYLLQTLPGMIDIDRIFADFQAGAEQGHAPSNNNNTIQNNNFIKRQS